MGADRTIKGAVTAGDVHRIQLFDGKFTTGYRLKRIVIAPKDVLTAEEVMVRVTTTKQAHSTTWDWSSNEEVAWATWNSYETAGVKTFSLVDEESIIVEDLFLDFSGDSGEVINYLLEIEHVTFSDWKGALSMVQNRSQGKGDA
jgi:hypothetical protein